MRRLLLVAAVSCMAALILFKAVATAHSGGTDSVGGHYDRSTGEYHYHHGHEAHQYIDGECPFDFDDATGSRGTGSAGAPSRSLPTPTPTPAPTPEPEPETDVLDVMLKCLGILLLVLMIGCCVEVVVTRWRERRRKGGSL